MQSCVCGLPGYSISYSDTKISVLTCNACDLDLTFLIYAGNIILLAVLITLCLLVPAIGQCIFQFRLFIIILIILIILFKILLVAERKRTIEGISCICRLILYAQKIFSKGHTVNRALCKLG